MRRYFRSLIVIAVLAVPAAAVALAACGGSSGGGSDDEKQITAAIVDSGTTDNPANCTELETQRFVEQNQADSGQAALDACKTSKNSADSIEVADIKVDGDGATAKASVTGSALDGQTVQISLVKDGDQWKLDHIDKFIDFDRDAFFAAFEKTLVTGVNPTTPAEATCVTDAIGKLDDEKIQATFISGDQNQLVSIITPCFTG